MQRTELGQKPLKLLGMHFWQVDVLSLPFMKKVRCQHWQPSPNAILVAYILCLGRPMLVRVIWWRQRKLIFLHGMGKRKGPLWLKPGICYTLLSVVNTWKSCPCHQQPQTYFIIPCKSIMLSYLILSCEPIMPSWLVKLLTSKAQPTYILQSWDINGGFLILANANQLTEPLELIQIMYATA